ncbi:MAG: hypothetical protein IJG65_02120 [Synergistaceae bacterium]|nr:hypothetical protein [Synergistaceae bacterium]
MKKVLCVVLVVVIALLSRTAFAISSNRPENEGYSVPEEGLSIASAGEKSDTAPESEVKQETGQDSLKFLYPEGYLAGSIFRD